MNATYREQLKQQNYIEAGLAQYWGYDLANITIDQKYQQQIHEHVPTVANITLRKFTKQIQKTQKIKQVQDQIRALQNERMLRQMRQSKQQQPSIQQKSEIINLMQRLIGDYNHIVEHKHLTQNKGISPQKKQQTKITRKEQDSKSLLKLIQQKRKELASADLGQQIKINKQIAILYRKHNADNMSSLTLKNRSTSQEPISQHAKINKYQSQTFDNIPQLSSNKYQSLKMDQNQEIKKMLLFKNQSNTEGLTQTQIVTKFKQLQMKRYGRVNRKQSILFENVSQNRNDKKNNSLQKTIKSPFLDQRQAQSYKQLQSKIKNNSQALQIWRNKIQDFNKSSPLSIRRQNAQKQSKQQAQKTKERQQQLYEILAKQIKIHNLQFNANNIFTQEIKYKEKQHQQQKQQIFAELLRKKNNKFNRLWGTRILVKYNSQQQAKSMLKGDTDKIPSRTTNTASQQSNRSRNYSKSVRLDRSQQVNNFTPREKVGNQQGNEIDWRGEQKDEQHYWRMCKNEKINLLLKRR